MIELLTVDVREWHANPDCCDSAADALGCGALGCGVLGEDSYRISLEEVEMQATVSVCRGKLPVMHNEFGDVVAEFPLGCLGKSESRLAKLRNGGHPGSLAMPRAALVLDLVHELGHTIGVALGFPESKLAFIAVRTAEEPLSSS